MSEQPPWQPPQPGPAKPSQPANPYGYPPPNPYAAAPQFPAYGYPPPNPYAAAPPNPYAAAPPNPYAAAPPNPYAAAPPNPYAAAPPNPYAAAPPNPYSYAPSQPARHARNLVIAGIVLALVVAVVVVEAAHPRSSTASSPGNAQALAQAPSSATAPAPSNQATQPSPQTPSSSPTQPTTAPTSDGVTASSTLSPTSGVEVFSDDFTDPTSGWSTGADPNGAVFAYGADGYTITSTVAAHWLAYAPYSDPVQQVNLNTTAYESAGARSTAGFGLVCRRGPDSTTNVRYEFIVNESNRWFIERNQGSVTLSSTPTIIDEGALPVNLGSQSLEISGICATLADGQTTRLALFVGAEKVADMTDVSSLDSDGWIGGLMSSGDGASSTTTFVGYAESDLGTDGILAANT